MSVEIRCGPNDKLIELGGGDNPRIRPNVDCRQCYDAAGNPTVDVVADFDQPLPIASESFDGVFCHFALEHVSFRNVPQFLAEVFRILKPGGRCAFAVPNVRAQIEWILANPGGWDGKDLFTSASELLYGSQNYPANSHKVYLDPNLATILFTQAGFSSAMVQPYGERNTDMMITATKAPPERKPYLPLPANPAPEQTTLCSGGLLSREASRAFDNRGVLPAMSPEQTTPVVHSGTFLAPAAELFDRHYFNGGGKVGGYAREGYRDFPVHEATAFHLRNKLAALGIRPGAHILELGGARGYVAKRLEDVGFKVTVMEVSRHCELTAVCFNFVRHDVTQTPWPFQTNQFDFAYSMAFLEHIPEQHLEKVFLELARVSLRGLHGVDFGQKDDGWDKTHFTLRSREWWRSRMIEVQEPIDKEELEKWPQDAEFQKSLLEGDGKVKVNVGSFITMFHHGWLNLDVHDLAQFAQSQGYRYLRHDVRQGLPFPTGGVDLVYAGHFLEHLTYADGEAFLRECRRVLRTTGALRLLVPDAELLTHGYADGTLGLYDEVNDGCASDTSQARKLWSLLGAGHQSYYDAKTLEQALRSAGFHAWSVRHRSTGEEYGIDTPNVDAHRQILRETLDVLPQLSLRVCASPKIA